MHRPHMARMYRLEREFDPEILVGEDDLEGGGGGDGDHVDDSPTFNIPVVISK